MGCFGDRGRGGVCKGGRGAVHEGGEGRGERGGEGGGWCRACLTFRNGGRDKWIDR